jgi:3',5'-cyclic AMP phosphodiesterase CpdA
VGRPHDPTAARRLDGAPTIAAILHISDLHLGTPQGWQQVDEHKLRLAGEDRRAQKDVIAQSIGKLLDDPRAELIKAVVVSGDLVNGKSREDGFREFPEFFEPLRKLVGAANVVVVPGNHDVPKKVPPGDPKRYDDFLAATRSKGFVTPLLDGVDFDRNGHLESRANGQRHLLRTKDFVLIPLNSSHYCWGLEPLEDVTLERFLDRVDNADVAAAVDELRRHDIPRVSNAQMAALQELLRAVDPSVLRPEAGDQRIRIAVLHHQLLPVSAREEFKSFESLTNLGAVREFLAALKIDVVLHGHKHEAALYWDYIANQRHFGEAPHRMLVSAAPGDFAPRRPVFRLLHLGERVLARDVKIEDILAPSGPAGSLGTESRRARLWHEPNPDAVTDATIVRDTTRDGVYAKIQSLFDDLKPKSPIHDLTCEIVEPVDLLSVPADYPEVDGVGDCGQWMADLVSWWQLRDPQLLQQVTFNHGNRIYRRFGNQVERAAEALAASGGAPTSTTRGIITLVDPREDGGLQGEFPSFVSVQLQLVWEGTKPRLDCTGYFRKQEMRYWWPINVAELGRIRDEVEGELSKRNLVVTTGRLRTITAFAAIENRLPTVALAAIDRAIDQHPEHLWEMAHSLARVKRVRRQEVRRIWEHYLADLDPGEASHPEIQLSYRGLDMIHEMLGWLGRADTKAGRALLALAEFYELLVEQGVDSGQQAVDQISVRLGALRKALDESLGRPRRRLRPAPLRFFSP